MAEFKVGDRVKWTYEGYSGTGVIVKHNNSDRYQWYVKRDTTGGPLNDYLFLETYNLALIDSVIKVGDMVKIARPDNATDNQFVGKIGKVVKIIERMSYPVLVDTDGSERWYSFKALEKNPVISEHHGFHVCDVVSVRGSGFTGKIAEFSNANRPGGITVVVVNDRGERRGITTTDIEKALSHKEEEKPRLQVGDRVRVMKDLYEDSFIGKTGVIVTDDQSSVPFVVHFDVAPDNFDQNGKRWFYAEELVKIEDVKPMENKIKVGDTVKIVDTDITYDAEFVGKTGMVTEINNARFMYPVKVQFEDYGPRRFTAKCLQKVEKQREERKFKVGDKVKIIVALPSVYNKVGVIAEDDKSSDRPLNVKNENGDHIFWCEPEWLEKVSEVKPVDDWRARFEAFKMSHPVGTKVKIAKKVEDDEHAEIWVDSMDKTVGRIGVIQSYDHNDNVYDINISSSDTEFAWNYPIAALEDVTETNQYTFTVKPSDVDLKRIWEESNPDFAVVVDYDKKSDYVEVLHKGKSVYGFVAFSVEREKAKDAIETWKRFYDEEKKQRIVVTIY